MMAWFRRKASAAETAAKALFRAVVETRQQLDDPGYYNVPEPVWGSYRGRMRIYREALILMTLLAKAQSDDAYEPLLRAYESLIFPNKPTDKGMVRLEALKSAMTALSVMAELASDRADLLGRLGAARGDLAQFLSPANARWFRWSSQWMAGIGHDTVDHANAVPCMEFAMNWADLYVLLQDAVDALRGTLEAS